MKRLTLSIMALAAIAMSCSKEQPASSSQTGGKGNFTINAVTEGISDDLKSYLDLSETQKYQTWESGDEIGIWEVGNATNSNVRFQFDAASENPRVGKFTGSIQLAGDEADLYGVFPYNSGNTVTDGKITLSLPGEIDQIAQYKTGGKDAVASTSFPLVAKTKMQKGASSATMTFRSPCALVDFRINGKSSIYEDGAVKSLTMTSDVAFVGSAEYDFASGALNTAATAGKSLKINFVESKSSLAYAVHTWASIWPVDLTAGNCNFVLELTNGQKVTFMVNPKEALVAQNIYQFNFELSQLDTYISKKKANPTYFDLVGAHGGYRGNCYIVNNGGCYKFAAEHVDKTFIDNIASVVWLWHDCEEIPLTGIAYGQSAKSVMFKAKANVNGNIVLAALDASKNILWSWHIWLSTTDPMNPQHYFRGPTWKLAATNIGAKAGTTGENAYGLYYQWGRKDPFPADYTKVTCNTGYSIAQAKAGEITDHVQYAIEHPNIFINDGNAVICTWIGDSYGFENATKLWNSSTTKTDKTNYDPCPAGWCVPPQPGYTWYGSTTFIIGNMTFADGGMSYNGGGVTGNSAYYPAAGLLKALAKDSFGTAGQYWSGLLTSGTIDGGKRSCYFGSSLYFTMNGTTLKNNNGGRSVFGMPVRCMRIPNE